MFNNIKIPDVPKNSNFTIIRMICCFIVIYEHIIVLSEIHFPILNIRGFAVYVFFILSGFWVTISFLRCKSIKEYAYKRIKKIFPIYYITIFICAFLLCWFSNLSISEYFTDRKFWKYLTANIITLNFLEPSLPGVFENCLLDGAVNGSLWTINIELCFYIFLPIFIYLINARNKNNDFLIIGGGLYVVSFLYKSFIHFFDGNRFFPFLINQFPEYLMYFISGILFIIYWDFFIQYLNKLLIPAITIIFCWLLFRNHNFAILISFLLPVALAICVMWCALKIKLPKFITNITDLSYPLYLVHFPIIQLFVSIGYFKLNSIITVISVFSFSFLCSYFLSKIINITFIKDR